MPQVKLAILKVIPLKKITFLGGELPQFRPRHCSNEVMDC